MRPPSVAPPAARSIVPLLIEKTSDKAPQKRLKSMMAAHASVELKLI